MPITRPESFMGEDTFYISELPVHFLQPLQSRPGADLSALWGGLTAARVRRPAADGDEAAVAHRQHFAHVAAEEPPEHRRHDDPARRPRLPEGAHEIEDPVRNEDHRPHDHRRDYRADEGDDGVRPHVDAGRGGTRRPHEIHPDLRLRLLEIGYCLSELDLILRLFQQAAALQPVYQ